VLPGSGRDRRTTPPRWTVPGHRPSLGHHTRRQAAGHDRTGRPFVPPAMTTGNRGIRPASAPRLRDCNTWPRRCRSRAPPPTREDRGPRRHRSGTPASAGRSRFAWWRWWRSEPGPAGAAARQRQPFCEVHRQHGPAVVPGPPRRGAVLWRRDPQRRDGNHLRVGGKVRVGFVFYLRGSASSLSGAASETSQVRAAIEP
jgi:hypothetical protein